MVKFADTTGQISRYMWSNSPKYSLIYLIFDVNELGISNSEKIKEVAAFREIDTFLISTKDAKLKKIN